MHDVYSVDENSVQKCRHQPRVQGIAQHLDSTGTGELRQRPHYRGRHLLSDHVSSSGEGC